MDEYLGVIKLFAGNRVPHGYMKCDGQLLPISNYQALYSILGTEYGGNGTQDFALPEINTPLNAGMYIICVEGTYPVTD
jgi:microcystin-dependent protein